MRARQGGFSFVDTMFAVVLASIVIGAAVPSLDTARRRFELASAARQVGAAIRAARLAAVTTNRIVRVRFNCPAAGQYRVVEVTGNPAVDNAGNRCDPAVFPHPDPNPAVRPDVDGPLMLLPVGITFAAAPDLQIAPNGRVTAMAGPLPATVAVRNPRLDTRNVTIAASGRVQVP